MNREWKRMLFAVVCLGILLLAGRMLPKPPETSTPPPSLENPVQPPNTGPNVPNPEGEDTTWQVRLVNKQNPISLDFAPEALASVEGNYELDARIVPAMQQMIQAADAEGIQLRLVSAYRTANLQQSLYEQEIQSFVDAGYSLVAATEEAGRWVAIPGTSEHQTGLAADIVSYDWLASGNGLTTDFEQDPAAIWLKNHAMEHGFILRYPKDKTEITGIGFEPWHYRYVGITAATLIMKQGVCLEEYLATTR